MEKYTGKDSRSNISLKKILFAEFTFDDFHVNGERERERDRNIQALDVLCHKRS